MAARLAETAYASVVASPVSCQTFYQQSQFVRFFQVATPSLDAAVDREQGAGPAVRAAEPSKSLQELVSLQLDQKLQALHKSAQAEGLATLYSS